VPPNTAPPEKPELAARDTAVAATLFDAAGTAGVKRVVYLSSVAVHRPFRAVEQSEITEKAPLAPSDLYGATKAAAAASFGFVGTALRLGPVVGPAAFPGACHRSDARISAWVRASLAGADLGPVPPGGRQFLGTSALRRIVLAALAASDDWAGPVLCVDGEVTQWAEIAALSGVARAIDRQSRGEGPIRSRPQANLLEAASREAARPLQQEPRFSTKRLEALLGGPLTSREDLLRHLETLRRS
jgi:nucleoside-diphosphate-sugar epimerase